MGVIMMIRRQLFWKDRLSLFLPVGLPGSSTPERTPADPRVPIPALKGI